MCARGAQVFSWQQVFDALDITGPAPEGGLQRFNVSPSAERKHATRWTRLPVVTANDQGQRIIQGMVWPLIPDWCHGQLPAFSTANCRSEPDEPFSTTMQKKPAFRDAWQQQRRCLIPFSWFYEWDQRSQPKQPWMVTLKDQPIMAMAGLWTVTQASPNATVLSCTIVTTSPNDVLKNIGHHRAPVVLDPDDWECWLQGTPQQAEGVLHPPEDAKLVTQPVSTKINNPEFNEDIRSHDT